MTSSVSTLIPDEVTVKTVIVTSEEMQPPPTVGGEHEEHGGDSVLVVTPEATPRSPPRVAAVLQRPSHR